MTISSRRRELSRKTTHKRFLELEGVTHNDTDEIKPHRLVGKVFEASGVEPVFLKKDQAINYVENRVSFRSDEIRILDSRGDAHGFAAASL
jgi:hypothetical protein